MSSDNITYSGPSRDHVPSDGANRDRKKKVSNVNDLFGYGDIDYLKRLLQVIKSESSELITGMETGLNRLGVVIRDIPEDDQLRDAVSVEWPSKLGEVGDFIPYPWFKALGFKNSSSATYIRDRWKTAARDVGGTRLYDLLQPVVMTRDEVIYVQDFIDRYIGDVNDSSEYRIIELFQDWAEVALAAIRKVGKHYESSALSKEFSEKDLANIGSTEAARYQALFTVRVNELNDSLDRDLSSLHKYWISTSDYFYNKALGPSLQFRLDGSRKVTQYSSKPALLADNIVKSLNQDLDSLITDQLRRNNIYVEKLDAFFDSIAMRDTYRNYIVQLHPASSKLLNSDIKMTETTIDPSVWFDDVETENTNKVSYGAYHSKLLGIDDISAHPQYLDRMGRNTIEGNIPVLDGVTIDGVDLSSHSHDGLDGSARIKGSSIDGLVASSIDADVLPDKPYNLRLLKSQPSTSGRGVDVHVAWDGSMDCHFEVQIAPVSGFIDNSTKRVFGGGLPTGSQIVQFATYDGVDFVAMVYYPSGSRIEFWWLSDSQGPSLLFTAEELAAFLQMDSEFVAEAVFSASKDFEVSEGGDIYMPWAAGADDFSFARGLTRFKRSTKSFSSIITDDSGRPDDAVRIFSSITLDHKTGKLVCLGFDSVQNHGQEATPVSDGVASIHPFILTCNLDGGDIEFLTEWPFDVEDMMIPFGRGTTSIDGFCYFLFTRLGTLDISLAKCNSISGFVEFIELPNDILSFLDVQFCNLVATKDEYILFKFSLSVDDIGYYSINKDGSISTDITHLVPVDPPIALASDKYGRVYTAKYGSNEIYRAFGQSGTGVY